MSDYLSVELNVCEKLYFVKCKRCDAMREKESARADVLASHRN